MVREQSPVGAAEACMFVQDRIDVSMHPDNWARDWVPFWENVAKQIDSLDAKALAPVAAVVRRLREAESEAA